MLNKVNVEGRIGTVLELKPIGDSKKLSFNLATENPGKKKDDPNYTQWISVEVWDKKAETVATYFKKGDNISVEGQLKTDSWEKDGQKMSRVYVSMKEFHFPLGSNKSDGAPQPKAAASAPVLDKEELPDF